MIHVRLETDAGASLTPRRSYFTLRSRRTRFALLAGETLEDSA